jgi:hypothetical protein
MANLSFLLDDAAAGHPDHPAIRMDDLAALHHDFVRLAPANAPTRAGAATMLGSLVDLSKVDVDAYVIAGISDRLCPWQSCYQTTQLLGGPVKLVLSTSGHMAAWSIRRPTPRTRSGPRRRTRPIRASSLRKDYPVRSAAPGSYIHDR